MRLWMPHLGLRYDEIAVSWTLPLDHQVDGLAIFREDLTDPLAVLNSGITEYWDETPIQGLNHTYTVKAFRQVDGNIYYSTGQSVAASTQNWANTPLLPSAFTATDDLPNVVKLCWEYPEFALSTFKVYRNDVEIADLPTTARAYYDYDGDKGVTYKYSLKAIYDTNETPLLHINGRKKCSNRLSGRVYSNDKKIGVPYIRVTALGTPFNQTTITDATGYYEFIDLPTGAVNLTVAGNNTNWSSDNAVVNIDCNTQDYIQDFVNNYEMPAFTPDELLPPLNVTAHTNMDMLDVAVSWTPANEVYDGFEIYRGLKLIGEVSAGNPFIFIDKDGAPGRIHAYQVRAFQDTAEGRIFSEYNSAAATFPILKAVSFLTALPFPTQNAVRLQWAHPQDIALSYLIERNGEVLATLDNPPLEYMDTTGLPGQLYTYAITAIYQNNTGTFESEEQSVTITYPEVLKPSSLTATPIMANEQVNWCGTQASSIFTNKVELTWEYPNAAAEAFELYRIAGEQEILITKVDGNIRNFVDREPFYDTSYEYEVRASINRAGVEYVSRPKKAAVTTTYMAPPINRNIVVNGTDGTIELRFSYPIWGCYAHKNLSHYTTL